MRYTVKIDYPPAEQLWGLIRDCVPEFFGDYSGINGPVDLIDWMQTYAESPIFVYADGDLACCAYLCGLERGFKAAIHCFAHPSYRSPKYLLPMSRIGMDLYFKAFDLNKIEGVVPSYNRAARLFDLRIGMKKDGRFRAHFFYNGTWHDAIFYSILRSEFYER